MPRPGIKPGQFLWEAVILTIRLLCLYHGQRGAHTNNVRAIYNTRSKQRPDLKVEGLMMIGLMKILQMNKIIL